MYRPDYQGGSIVNLIASIASGLGAPSGPYPPLTDLDPHVFSEARNVALILVDGLGDAYLCDRHPGSFLARHRRRPVTSVFPTTTASAVTSLLTGVAPQQHAVTGWFMWLREFGMVTTILPFVSRAGALDLAAAGLEPGRVLGARPLADTLDVETLMFSEQAIVDSPYSRATSGTARRQGYRGLDGFFAGLREALTVPADGRRFVYAYWSQFDATAHHEGPESEACARLLQEFDRGLESLAADLAGSGTLLLVTADHGFIATAPELYVELSDHPDLAECLALPLCGEPRAAYCYVRPGYEGRFECYVAGRLAEVCELRRSEELLREGWFGLGEPHPELEHRIGDYVLLLKDRHVIKDYLAGEKPFHFKGVHSGLSAAEMFVPLVVWEG